jgi:hypothetical protein
MTGSEFVGHQENCAFLAMALATALAILCYTIVVFLLNPLRPTSAQASLTRPSDYGIRSRP